MAEKKQKTNGKREKETIEEVVEKPRVHGDAKRSIVAILLFALALLLFLGFIDVAGSFGVWLSGAFGLLFGWGKWLFPIVLITAGIVLLRRKETSFYVLKLLGLSLAFWSFLGFLHIYLDSNILLEKAKTGEGGGFFGYAVAYVLLRFTGTIAGTVILASLFLIGLIVTYNLSIVHFCAWMKNKAIALKELRLKRDENSEDEDELAASEGVSEDELSKDDDSVQEDGDNEKDEQIEDTGNIANVKFVGEGDDEDSLTAPQDISLKDGNHNSRAASRVFTVRDTNAPWKFPPQTLLEDAKGGARGGDIKKNVDTIQQTLSHFGIEVEPGEVLIGPTVTQYSFRPAVGVKLSKIVSLGNDLSLALAAPSVRIEAPIPGKSLVGIEIPNKTAAVVRLKEMLKDEAYQERKSNLMLALGKDVSGNFVLGNLAKMPHLMVAGSTGSGKSVSINSILLSLLYQNSPEDLKLILVDPKRVELSLYNGIPHLICDVITDNNKVIAALKWAVGEMEKRYRLLQDTGSRDIASYNQKVEHGEKRRFTDPDTGEHIEEDLERLPFIVIVIDELADLMASHGKEVEGAIVRLAQMARAIGIHLIVSTQRPSVEVITGLIKANIVTRIAFQVATQIDSRTILDMGGAEKLLGNGDMLYLSAASPKPKRLQGVYVSEQEVKRVVKFLKDQRQIEEAEDFSTATVSKEYSPEQTIDFDAMGADAHEDDLYEEAKRLVVSTKKASTSFLQRHLRVGYSRAARLIDTLEERGVVGPANGSKPREILIGEGASKEQVIYAEPETDQAVRDKWQLM